MSKLHTQTLSQHFRVFDFFFLLLGPVLVFILNYLYSVRFFFSLFFFPFSLPLSWLIWVCCPKRMIYFFALFTQTKTKKNFLSFEPKQKMSNSISRNKLKQKEEAKKKNRKSEEQQTNIHTHKQKVQQTNINEVEKKWYTLHAVRGFVSTEKLQSHIEKSHRFGCVFFFVLSFSLALNGCMKQFNKTNANDTNN